MVIMNKLVKNSTKINKAIYKTRTTVFKYNFLLNQQISSVSINLAGSQLGKNHRMFFIFNTLNKPA